MKSSNPELARVVAEINIHEAVAAIEHFAENGPEDRHSRFIGLRLLDAALTICSKAEASLQKSLNDAAKEEENKKKFQVHGDTTGRFQCKVPNHGNTPKEEWTDLGKIQSVSFTLKPDKSVRDSLDGALRSIESLGVPCALADATGYVDVDEPTMDEILGKGSKAGYGGREPIVGPSILCPDCLVWRNECGPDVHSSNCPQIMSSLKGKRDKAS